MNNKIIIPKLLFMKIKLRRKYDTTITFYNKKKINELIFNDSSLYTAKFKEYLLLEDENEFFRRYYKYSELKKKLTSIYSFYANYSKIFPNYIIIPESKYMYKNIQKKQKMIDNLQKIKRHEKRIKERKISNDTIFTNGALNSILNQTDSFYKKNLKNIIDITFTNDDTINDINKIINKIEQNEINKKPIINIIMNKKKNFIKDLSSINSPREESSKIYRNSQSNISNKFLTEYFFNKTKLKKPKIKEQERYPTIGSSTSRNNINNHQKINSQNLNPNIKRKILQMDSANFNFKVNFDNIKTLKINSIDKKNLTMKYKENFSISSSRHKPFIKYNSSNESNRKITTLSNSPRNDFLTERIDKKILSKRIIPLKTDTRHKSNIVFLNSIFTDNLKITNKNKIRFEPNKKLKLRGLFNQN
jgi:hypothetical protein